MYRVHVCTSISDSFTRQYIVLEHLASSSYSYQVFIEVKFSFTCV